MIKSNQYSNFPFASRIVGLSLMEHNGVKQNYLTLLYNDH